MYIRFLFLFLFLFTALLISSLFGGEEKNSNTVQLYADKFESKADIVYAYDVVISYDGTLFIGDKALFNRKERVIIVSGNVEIFGKDGNKIIADKVRFETAKHHLIFKDFYHTDRDDIWLYADDAEKLDGNYTLKNSMLSSCSPDNPDWTLRFKEADYDSSSKYLKLKSVALYAKDIPIFYTPYLAFSLEHHRSSGFLMPHFGLKKDEGFVYDQPFFWAISDSMDMQFDPQIRTKRGEGLYTTFRFANSPSSYMILKTGYFHDKDSYYHSQNLEHQNHYGFELLYQDSDFLKDWRPKDYRGGLYANIDLFNDLDYLTLQYGTLGHLEETSRYKESRINAFLYNNSNYFGISGRYFIDTSSLDNNETIQELPSFQYHKFSTPLFDHIISYSFDAEFKNYYSKDGANAYREYISLPFMFHKTIFDDYINFFATEEMRVNDTYFYGDYFDKNTILKDSDYYASLTMNHTIGFSSDLIKSYSSGLHTLLLETEWTKSSLIAESGIDYNSLDYNLIDNFDLDQIYNTRVAFSIHNFWDSYNSPLKIDHLLLADYYPDKIIYRWNKLRQELHLSYDFLSLSSRLDYSFEYNKFSQISNSLSYNRDDFYISLNQVKIMKESDGTIDENDVGFSAKYRLNQQFILYGGSDYDFKTDSLKDWELGVGLDRKCWNFKILLKQDITPVLTKEGEGSSKNNSIYFKFNLVPFGGAGSEGSSF